MPAGVSDILPRWLLSKYLIRSIGRIQPLIPCWEIARFTLYYMLGKTTHFYMSRLFVNQTNLGQLSVFLLFTTEYCDEQQFWPVLPSQCLPSWKNCSHAPNFFRSFPWLSKPISKFLNSFKNLPNWCTDKETYKYYLTGSRNN